jgi:predicted alpha/beta hydrolase
MNQPVTITCADGRTLAASFFPAAEPKAALLLGGATGVPRGFYRHYAAWLATQGFSTLTFDYRGIGDSRIQPLKNDSARMRDWGQLDLPAALETLASLAPDLPLALIGNSVGSQMLGLMPNAKRIQATVMIAAGIGYYGNMPLAMQGFSLLIWHGIEPLVRQTLGYLPSSKLGWGEDLPKDVARDWRNWCLRSDYFAELLPAHFADVTSPILSLRMPDDSIATEKNIQALLGFYPNAASKEIRLLLPQDFGVKAIGHLHFFARNQPETLWQVPVQWLRQQLGL